MPRDYTDFLALGDSRFMFMILPFATSVAHVPPGSTGHRNAEDARISRTPFGAPHEGCSGVANCSDQSIRQSHEIGPVGARPDLDNGKSHPGLIANRDLDPPSRRSALAGLGAYVAQLVIIAAQNIDFQPVRSGRVGFRCIRRAGRNDRTELPQKRPGEGFFPVAQHDHHGSCPILVTVGRLQGVLRPRQAPGGCYVGASQRNERGNQLLAVTFTDEGPVAEITVTGRPWIDVGDPPGPEGVRG